MFEQNSSIIIEIPFDVAQEEAWDVEEKLKQIEGITTDLQEPRDLVAAAMLILHFTTTVMEPIGIIGGGITAIHDVAKIIYDFLHSKHKESASATGKGKVIIIKKGKRIELYNLSIEEIEKILKEQ